MNEQRKSEKKEDNLFKGKKTVDKNTQKKNNGKTNKNDSKINIY